MAYESLQSFKCPECGDWLWRCSSEVKGTEYVSYNIHEHFCRRTRVFLTYMDSKRPKKERAKKPERDGWGVIHRVEPHIDKIHAKDGIEMPGYKEFLDWSKKSDSQSIQ